MLYNILFERLPEINKVNLVSKSLLLNSYFIIRRNIIFSLLRTRNRHEASMIFKKYIEKRQKDIDDIKQKETEKYNMV